VIGDGTATAVTLAVIAAAMVAILLVRRWLVAHPFGLKPLDVRDDDPLLREAEARARKSLPAFLRLLPDHMGRAYVKFAFATDAGTTEHLWARVEAREGDRLRVQVETPPRDHGGAFEAERTLAPADLEDWQIEMEDGTIRGGYTLHAMFAIHRRDVGPIPKRFAALEALYVDGKPPGGFP